MIELKYVIFENEDFWKSFRELQSEKMSLQNSVTLTKISKLLAEEAKIYEEKKLEILTKYGEPGEKKGDKQAYTIKDREEYANHITELINITFSLPFEKINLSDTVTVSSKDLLLLADFVTVDGKGILELLEIDKKDLSPAEEKESVL